MKPGDHPDFYRFAPPPGTSRESTIVLDASGELWHDGDRMEHGPLANALHRWISVHPEDGRYILTNGYDWCYLEVEDVPYFVLGVTDGDPPELELSDGTSEALDPDAVAVDERGALYTRIKGGRFWARFGRHAESDLGAFIAAEEPPRLVISGRAHPIGRR